MSQVKEMTFWSADKAYGIVLSSESLTAMLQHCRESKKLETGGILIGKYSEELNCALVTEVMGPPKDSKRTATTFERGIVGLKQHLDKRFAAEKTYYIGEWHFHPGASSEPSGRDFNQLKEIAASDRFKCPEPDLIIIGGDPEGTWTVSAHVVFKSGSFLRLVFMEEAK